LKEEGDAGRVESTQQYSATEVERMMKLQDVLLKAMAGKMTCPQAGFSPSLVQ
jgi:hypothetical protein